MGWWDWDRWPLLQRRGNHVFVKLFVSLLLLGISFRFFFSSDSFASLPLSQPADVEDVREVIGDSEPIENDFASNTSEPIENDFASNTSVPEVAIEDGIDHRQKDKCDLFTGEWVSNPSGPAYTNESCPFIEPPQNCMKNGRPDTGYLYWRWKPFGCVVPPFDAEKFLDVMRDKSWALIGDSILRNHVQSLICLLVKVEMPVEVEHDEQYKSRRWHFPSHNFTLSIIWSPFLAKAETFENEDGVSTAEIELHLDVLDTKWTGRYQNFDYILISGGQWFLKTTIYWENNTIIGCHNCQGKNLTDIPPGYPLRKVLQTVYRFFATSKHKPFILYRTWTPDHFENGEWFNGGACNRTVPYKKGEFLGRDIDHLMLEIELEEFKNATGNGVRLKLLDTYRLSLLRPDGHSGPYRTFHPFDKNSVRGPNDCLHWCLPGPIDSWNDLVMELVLNGN